MAIDMAKDSEIVWKKTRSRGVRVQCHEGGRQSKEKKSPIVKNGSEKVMIHPESWDEEADHNRRE